MSRDLACRASSKALPRSVSSGRSRCALVLLPRYSHNHYHPDDPPKTFHFADIRHTFGVYPGGTVKEAPSKERLGLGLSRHLAKETELSPKEYDAKAGVCHCVGSPSPSDPNPPPPPTQPNPPPPPTQPNPPPPPQAPTTQQAVPVVLPYQPAPPVIYVTSPTSPPPVIALAPPAH
ncbi:hypothetical protein O181_009544 [Austropuccinia psidii MF-1]|uniref:Uncharacterized protein n=1 Tax=Austropuccinia psidii MF-1 TaxID=1389203 RepID=A0A9Q3BPH3_9BASI|nr:hypothetical protein [Austropuccinia psidii MF-1]